MVIVSQETIHFRFVVVAAAFILGSTKAVLACLVSVPVSAVGSLCWQMGGTHGESHINSLIDIALLRPFSPFGQSPKRE